MSVQVDVFTGLQPHAVVGIRVADQRDVVRDTPDERMGGVDARVDDGDTHTTSRAIAVCPVGGDRMIEAEVGSGTRTVAVERFRPRREIERLVDAGLAHVPVAQRSKASRTACTIGVTRAFSVGPRAVNRWISASSSTTAVSNKVAAMSTIASSAR